MPNDRQALFDEWAADYDIDAEQAARFPFIGYHDVLSQVASRVALTEPTVVIELGAGTGTLTSLLRGLLPTAELIAVDFSQPMLDRLEALEIGVRTVRSDLSSGSLPDLGRADVITGTYVLHELTDPCKVQLVGELASNHLEPWGRIVIGDVGFPDAQAREAAHARFAGDWDKNEHYLAVHELSCQVTAADLVLSDAFYPSECASVIELQPAIDQAGGVPQHSQA